MRGPGGRGEPAGLRVVPIVARLRAERGRARPAGGAAGGRLRLGALRALRAGGPA